MSYTETQTPKKPAATKSPCGCGCQDGSKKHDPDCCNLVCFERPNYFCGHLLSDADLTLGQNYFREKSKLYHRTMEGFGVVCGLRLRCDPHCDGQIQVSNGFAIDCCGNDLVVCQPTTYDVLGELRKRKWIVEAPKDPCKKDEHQDRDCTGKHCFYVGICYEEQDAEFITPFQTDCSPGPSSCEPTRIREGVRFELYQEMPTRPNPLDEIEKRIERCFAIFREGQFSRGLTQYAPEILSILESNPQAHEEGNREEYQQEYQDPCDLFCKVRALFLHQLRVCPDAYNCNLEHEVWKICCPEGTQQFDRGEVESAFKRLFELVQKYVFSCVLAEFAFLCPEPSDPCCVLLGSVEVEHGRLTRVINYPRWYLWCFQNFLEVLMYTLANQAACEPHKSRTKVENTERGAHKNDGCCPGFEVDVKEFLSLFLADSRASETAARSFVQATRAVFLSLVDGFDFVSPHGVSPQVLRNMSRQKASRISDSFQFSLDVVGEGKLPEENDPVSLLLSFLIHRGAQPLAVHEALRAQEEVVAEASRYLNAPIRETGPTKGERYAAMKEELIREVKEQVLQEIKKKGKQQP